MPYADVLDEMVVQTRRKLAAYEALVAVCDEPEIDFTGTAITVDELTTHSRSEAALHRWDLVGDDALADELLADPELTAHAVKILNRMPTLPESARSIAARAAAHRSPRIVLRAPGRPTSASTPAGHGQAELAAADPLDGDLVITTDPAHRLLVLWGRRSTQRPIDIDGPAELAAAASTIVWSTRHPGHRQQRRADRRH